MKKGRLGLGDLVAVLGILWVLGAILFPVFMQAHEGGSYAVVLDGDGKRVAGATLRFRNRRGQIVGTATMGPGGEVRWRDGLRFEKEGWRVDGYGLARRAGWRSWYFSPLGLHLVETRTTAGAIVPNFALFARPVTRTYHGPGVEWEQDGRANERGVWNMGLHPVCARFELKSADPKHWVVVEQTATPNTDGILYTVTVAPPATIRGKVFANSGATVGGWYVFAVNDEKNAATRSGTAIVGAGGRFEIGGLPPGRYRVAAHPTNSSRQATTVACVPVQSGQTRWAGVLTAP